MKFYVSIPIKGTSTFEVNAVDEEAAIAAAWKKVDDGKRGDVTWEYFEGQRTGDNVEVTPERESSDTKGQAER